MKPPWQSTKVRWVGWAFIMASLVILATSEALASTTEFPTTYTFLKLLATLQDFSLAGYIDHVARYEKARLVALLMSTCALVAGYAICCREELGRRRRIAACVVMVAVPMIAHALVLGPYALGWPILGALFAVGAAYQLVAGGLDGEFFQEHMPQFAIVWCWMVFAGILLLKAWRQRHGRACGSCGYPREGWQGDMCPECGRLQHDPPPTQPPRVEQAPPNAS